MNANYAVDQTLLANTSAQAECLLHSLEPPARGIGLYVISDKTDFISFKQDDVIYTHIYQPLCSGRIWHKVNL